MTLRGPVQSYDFRILFNHPINVTASQPECRLRWNVHVQREVYNQDQCRLAQHHDRRAGF